MEINLGRDSGAESEEEIGEVTGEGGGEEGEGVVGPTSGGLDHEGEEEHVDDGECVPYDLALHLVSSIAHDSVHQNLVEDARPYPHERHQEICCQQPPPSRHC